MKRVLAVLGLLVFMCSLCMPIGVLVGCDQYNTALGPRLHLMFSEVTLPQDFDRWELLLSTETGGVHAPFDYPGTFTYRGEYQDPEFRLVAPLQVGVKYYGRAFVYLKNGAMSDFSSEFTFVLPEEQAIKTYRGICPWYARDNSWNTSYNILNPTSNPVDVKITYYTTGGNVVEVIKTIQPKKSVAEYIPTTLNYGYATLESSAPCTYIFLVMSPAVTIPVYGEMK